MKYLTSLLVLSSLLLSSVIAAGNPATFWSDYPTCEDDCHQSVWASQSCSLANSCSCSGCLCLADSCLCETSSWLTAVAQCIGEQCGSSGVIDAASIASSACAGAGYPLVVPSASLVSIGLAALPATTTQESAAKSSTSSETGGSVVQSVDSTATTTVTNTPTSQMAPAVATTGSSTTVVAGGSLTTTSNLSSTRTSVAPASSPLSSGAKAGIGIGAALAVIIIVALLAFIFYQRRKHSKLNIAVPVEGTATSTGIFKLNGGGRAFSGIEKKNMVGDRKAPSGLQGGGNSVVSPASQLGAATFAGEGRVLNVAEIAAPLSVEEKQELERRRRATELSGAGSDIPVETGIGERSELETRRRVYEMA